MVAATPQRIRDDAFALFTSAPLPSTFEFYSRLAPHHQRLFAVDVWNALARVKICETREDLEALAELVGAWEATALVDSSPEIVAVLTGPRNYQPFDVQARASQ